MLFKGRRAVKQNEKQRNETKCMKQQTVCSEKAQCLQQFLHAKYIPWWDECIFEMQLFSSFRQNERSVLQFLHLTQIHTHARTYAFGAELPSMKRTETALDEIRNVCCCTRTF